MIVHIKETHTHINCVNGLKGRDISLNVTRRGFSGLSAQPGARQTRTVRPFLVFFNPVFLVR